MQEMGNYLRLQQRLAHVYWLGGSPCAGKSSIADTLVTSRGMTLYRADDAFSAHTEKITAGQQPIFYKVTHYSSEQLWMRPVEQQAAEEVALYREEFALILEDLLALPATKPILAEGAALLPACVAPLLQDPRHAIWVVPSVEFQLHHYAQRVWARDVVKGCTQPEQAFQNWMQRDIRFARHVIQEAQRLKQRVLVVDGMRSLVETTAEVRHHFSLA
jgi:hypothetical protein